jgi:septum formation protein
MLRAYSGRTHSVLTAVAIAWHSRLELAVSESVVTFKLLDEDEIRAYILGNEPYDKAGGYGIQGRAAGFIEHLSGSYSGVMGLPLFETSELLRSLGFDMT